MGIAIVHSVTPASPLLPRTHFVLQELVMRQAAKTVRIKTGRAAAHCFIMEQKGPDKAMLLLRARRVAPRRRTAGIRMFVLSPVNHPAPATSRGELLRSKSVGGGRFSPSPRRPGGPSGTATCGPPTPDPKCAGLGRAPDLMQVSAPERRQRQPSFGRGRSDLPAMTARDADRRRPPFWRRSLAEISLKER